MTETREEYLERIFKECDEAFNLNEDNIDEVLPRTSSSVVDSSVLRFKDAEWFDGIRNSTILVAGIGGIGSWVSLLVARLQPLQLLLVDPDTVEKVNLAGQLYKVTHVGMKKAYSATEVIRDFTTYYNMYNYEERLTENTHLPRVVICGFDNMEARSAAFNNWVTTYAGASNALFIDGRLSAEMLQIFCITGDDTYNMERYRREFLFSDSEAEGTTCTYSQTSFMAAMIASLIVNLVVNFHVNKENSIRSLPFYTEYYASNMYLKTEM